MSPNDAPSMIAMKKVGQLFEEGDSDSSVMIVLEGQEPLGDESHAWYDQMVKKLEADTAHVQSVQDFWSDPLTAAGSQSNDGKAAYVQVKLSGNQGETLANESVESVQSIIGSLKPPPGVKAYVTGPAALAADQHIAGDRSMKMIEAVTFTVIIIMLLLVYRSIVDAADHAGHGRAVADGCPRGGRFPGLSRDHRALDVRDQPVSDPRDSRGDGLRHLLHRPISGSARRWRGQRDRLLHDVPRHRARSAGVGTDHRRCDGLSWPSPGFRTSRPLASRWRSAWSWWCWPGSR